MNSKVKAKNLIVFLLTAIVFSSLAFAAYADGDDAAQSPKYRIDKVYIDSVIWPVPGRQIPRMDMAGTDGKTDEQKDQIAKYNAENFIRVPEGLRSLYEIKDAYWLYKSTQGKEPTEFVKVPDDDLLFRAGYEYKLKVLIQSKNDLNVYDNPKEKILPYYDLSEELQVEEAVSRYDYSVNTARGRDKAKLSVFLYNRPDKAADDTNEYARFDILFENNPYSNPFDVLNTVRVRQRNGNALSVSNIGKTMVVSAGANRVYGESLPTDPGSTVFQNAASVTVTYAGSEDYAVIPDVQAPVAMMAMLGATPPVEYSVTDVTFKEAECCFASVDPMAITVKNNGTADLVIPSGKIELTGTNASSFTLSSTGPLTVPASGTSTAITIQPKPGLHGGDYECTVKFTSEDNLEKTATVKIKVVHKYDDYQGGWCIKCDEYKKDFVGRIQTGSGKTYYQNSWPQFTVNLMEKHVDSVYVDGNPITPGTDYSYAKEKYTKFTLQNSYIRSIGTGRHTIKFVFKDAAGNTHSASGYFRISSATAAYTGDDADFTRACFLGISALLGIYALIFYSLSRRFRKNH